MNYFHIYGTQFVQFHIWNAMLERVNKRQDVCVRAYFQHLSIDYHLENITRVGPGKMPVGRLLIFQEKICRRPISV